MSIILAIIASILLICIVNNFMTLLFDYSENNSKQKRLSQLKKIKTKENVTFKDIMDFIALKSDKKLMPRVRKLFPSLFKYDLTELDRDLKLIGWDDTFTAETFVSSTWGLKFIGIIVIFIGFIFNNKMFFGLIGIVLFFGFDYYIKSEVKSKKAELLSEFPDFIRIVSGYLSADIPLVKSIKSSIKYVGDGWEPILTTFVIDCDQSVDFALDRMKSTADLFEINEFVSLIKLTLEQGGKAKDGFLSQADKIEELQKEQFILKISKRKTLSQLIQLPLLIINMIIISLPIFAQAMNMFSGTGMTFTTIVN